MNLFLLWSLFFHGLHAMSLSVDNSRDMLIKNVAMGGGSTNLLQPLDSNVVFKSSLSMKYIEESVAFNLIHCQSKSIRELSLNSAKIVALSALLMAKANRFQTVLNDVMEKELVFTKCEIPNFSYLMRSAIAMSLEDKKNESLATVKKGQSLSQLDSLFPTPGVLCDTGFEKLVSDSYSSRLLKLVINSSVSDENYVLEYLFSVFQPGIIGMLMESVELFIQFLGSSLPLVECPSQYDIMKQYTISTIVSRDNLENSLIKLNQALMLASAFVERFEQRPYMSFLHYFSGLPYFKQDIVSSDIQNERLLIECKYLEMRSDRAVELLKHVSYSQLKKAWKKVDKDGWKQFSKKLSKPKIDKKKNLGKKVMT